MMEFNKDNSKGTFSNVQVTVRVKPCPRDTISVISKIANNPKLIKICDESFSFDHVKWENESQERLYKAAAYPFVEKALEGYSATILVFGQTGSGKSYTMGSLVPMTSTWRNSGLVQRCLKHIFEQSDIEVTASFVEIYNEELHDLLHKKTPIIMHRGGEINLKTEKIASCKEGLLLVRKALELRQERMISSHTSTSQSHAIFTFYLRINYGNYSRTSKLNLVDLAGTRTVERVEISSDEPFGVKFCINQGLFALNKVITAMSENKDLVPILYEDSLLTIILKDSLDTKSHISLVVCLSPCPSDYNDSLRTLQFAKRAKLVEIHPTQSRVTNCADSFADQLKETTRQLSILLSPLPSNVAVFKQQHHQKSIVKPSTKSKMKSCTVVIKKSDLDFKKYRGMHEHKENIVPLNHTDNKTNIQNPQVSLTGDEAVFSLASTVSISKLQSQSIHEPSINIGSTKFERSNRATKLEDNFSSSYSDSVTTEEMKLQFSESEISLEDQCQCPAFDFQCLNDFNKFEEFMQCNNTARKANYHYQASVHNEIEHDTINTCSKHRIETSKRQVEKQSCSTSQDFSSSDQFYEKPETCYVAGNKMKRKRNVVLTSDTPKFANAKTRNVRRFYETGSSQMNFYYPNKFMKTDAKRSTVISNQDTNFCKCEAQSSEHDCCGCSKNLNSDLKDKKLAHSEYILRILNTGNKKQLATLPQIGSKTAIVIYQYRLMNGEFKSLKELRNIPTWSKKFSDKFFAANNLSFE